MRLMGNANWWFPRWLGRIIPNLDIEGESRLPPAEMEADAAKRSIPEKAAPEFV